MNSCLYEGTVQHRRRAPVPHGFRFPLCMFYLDLDELDDVFGDRWLWSHRRSAWGWLRRADHLGDPGVPLDRLRCATSSRSGRGRRPTGPIRMLTQLRIAGYVINPISLFYCFEEDGVGLDAVVAEVTSTPWQERCCYVIRIRWRGRPARAAASDAAKQLHVSPFMPMDLSYRFVAAPTPGRTGLRDRRAGGRTEARSSTPPSRSRRREISTASLAASRVPISR